MRLIHQATNHFPFVARALRQCCQSVSLNNILIQDATGVRITRNEAERWMAPNAFAWIQPRVNDGYFIPLAERKSVSRWVSDVRCSKLKQPALLRPRTAMEISHVPVTRGMSRIHSLHRLAGNLPWSAWGNVEQTSCDSPRVATESTPCGYIPYWQSLRTAIQCPALLWLWGLPFSVDEWQFTMTMALRSSVRWDCFMASRLLIE